MLAKKLQGAAAAAVPAYIEDVFSTWLYTGNGSTQTITNGIDLAGKGGLVWTKQRTVGQNNSLFDTVRGANNAIYTDSTVAQQTQANSVSFTASGFSVGSASVTNANNVPIVSWTFREQPKFFDVVTYTGNGSNRTIAHNLGAVPGCIIVKRTDTTGNWAVYHRTLGNTQYAFLNNNSAASTDTTLWNSTTPTSAVFSLGTSQTVNDSGGTYVAYIFAHDAGGFGLSGTDNVISCGGYTGNGSTTGPTVTLNYEPQWLLVRKTGGSGGSWILVDNMRGLSFAAPPRELLANAANAEGALSLANGSITPTATGFSINTSNGSVNESGIAYIYIAIRRGPMKTPTSGTSVFAPVLEASSTSPQTVTAGFPVDMNISFLRNAVNDKYVFDRLRGSTTTSGAYLRTNLTNAEGFPSGWGIGFDNSTGVVDNGLWNNSNAEFWNFRRAPGFFDVVCWTGNATGNARNHNLTVYPELVISKLRSGGAGFGAWDVQNNINPSAKQTGFLNTTAAFSSSGATSPTATVFYPTNDASGATYVTYLFASCPGVSKVGSYTGSGTTKQIDCGFTGGARFVLIKRTDSTGDWYVWDSARGIVAGNDPYLLLNSAAAEVTTTDYIDTYSAGFEISSTAPAAINANGGTFIFLAIA